VIAAILSNQVTVTQVMARFVLVFNDVLPLSEFIARSKNIMIDTDISPNVPSLPLDVKQME
jgi:hypothetical protein